MRHAWLAFLLLAGCVGGPAPPAALPEGLDASPTPTPDSPVQVLGHPWDDCSFHAPGDPAQHVCLMEAMQRHAGHHGCVTLRHWAGEAGGAASQPLPPISCMHAAGTSWSGLPPCTPPEAACSTAAVAGNFSRIDLALPMPERLQAWATASELRIPRAMDHVTYVGHAGRASLHAASALRFDGTSDDLRVERVGQANLTGTFGRLGIFEADAVRLDATAGSVLAFAAQASITGNYSVLDVRAAATVQLQQGTNLTLAAGPSVELAGTLASLSVEAPGAVRLDVRPAGNATLEVRGSRVVVSLREVDAYLVDLLFYGPEGKFEDRLRMSPYGHQDGRMHYLWPGSPDATDLVRLQVHADELVVQRSP